MGIHQFINDRFDAYQPKTGGDFERKPDGCRNRMFGLLGTAGVLLGYYLIGRTALGGGDGVNAQPYDDGTTHVTIYRQGQAPGDKGIRTSFNHDPYSGDVSQVHTMNQNTRKYTQGKDAIEDYWSN